MKSPAPAPVPASPATPPVSPAPATNPAPEAHRNPPLHPVLARVTERVIERSKTLRTAYLARIEAAAGAAPHRSSLACGNLAHGFAACAPADKAALKATVKPDIAIVSAYNDMLSAHQPFEHYPALLKEAVAAAGGVAQFAGGVPAMCDGITQGQPGMELSLFSRDVIAMSTAIALSHNMFDGALCLGVCDKIVPGLLIGALSFGHLPVLFVPAGPMTSGVPNADKSHIRQLFAEGRVSREALLESEAASYHGPGTCTFFGTANSNQMLMEIMGLHLPGSSFVNPGTPLREALTREAGRRVATSTRLDEDYRPLGQLVDERTLLNGVVGLLATGGSTNHTLHLVAMAAAAGVQLTWQDFSELSAVVPLLARIYPNGEADVNQFHAAGGMAFLIGELLDAGLLHRDVRTVIGDGLDAYRQEPYLIGGRLEWREGSGSSLDENILRPHARPFAADGGLRILTGNLGRSVIKVSAVQPAHRVVEAPAVVFDSQEALLAAFQRGELDRDFVAVVRFQGPRANGMPELHSLTPCLSVLQERGRHVALVTDGRMSGASGRVPAAIHLSPEAVAGGPIALIRDGDLMRLDAEQGTLELKVSEAILARRTPARADLSGNDFGSGRELFGVFRRMVGAAEDGASVFGEEPRERERPPPSATPPPSASRPPPPQAGYVSKKGAPGNSLLEESYD